MNGTPKNPGQLASTPNPYWLTRSAIAVITAATVVAILYFARDVLIPFSLAVLLSFLLAPLAERLQRWGCNRVISVILTAIISFGTMGGVLTVVATQAIDAVQQFPQYEQNLRAKIRTLRGPFGTSFAKSSQTIDDLTAELQRSTGRRGPTNVAKVQIVQPDDPIHIIREVLGPIIKPVGAALVVIVFVVFMLLERADLRERLIRLLGARDLYTATQALDDAASRVTRYLLMQTVVNSIFGIALALGLYLIGVPSAVLWGAIAMGLRFIPFIGAWIASSLPIALSFAVFDDWQHPLMTMGLYAGLELVTANIVEPLVYGTGTGVSSLALLVAAAFWTWLWGIPGLLLAVPLTVCLFVTGKYVPQLRFLTVMLGDRPVLDPHERLYQRLLADHLEEAEELLLAAVKVDLPQQVLDDMVIPAMQLVEADHLRGALAADQRKTILGMIRELAGELAQYSISTTDPIPARSIGSEVRILCIPAADEADELCAELFAGVIRSTGAEIRTSAVVSLAGEVMTSIEEFRPHIICISALPPGAAIHARYLCKRIHERFGATHVLVGLWNAQGETQKTIERLQSCGASHVFTHFADGITQVVQVIQAIPPARTTAAVESYAEPEAPAKLISEASLATRVF
jgi:predicted PurR-regulated permease PerM/methylmalonyl-CoA mutase cobalamin-binding subunit